MWYWLVIIFALVFIAFFSYACCAAAGRADEKAERMFAEFLEKDSENMR